MKKTNNNRENTQFGQKLKNFLARNQCKKPSSVSVLWENNRRKIKSLQKIRDYQVFMQDEAQ